MIDIHSHIHDKAFDIDRGEVLGRMQAAGINTVTIGTDIVESKKAVDTAEKYANVWCTVGVHPHDDEGAVFDEAEFAKLLECKKVVGIGECGLDYFYLERDKASGKIENMDREIDRQRDLFTQQIRFAAEHDLPLMIHGRPSKKEITDNPDGMDAYTDILFILDDFKKNNTQLSDRVRGNVHFFVGDINIARQFLELGFTFSFGGVATLTEDYDETIKYIPIENIHLETDSPYVAPKQWRGQRNTPEYLPIILKRIAEIKNINEEDLVVQLNKNAERVFRVKV